MLRCRGGEVSVEPAGRTRRTTCQLIWEKGLDDSPTRTFLISGSPITVALTGGTCSPLSCPVIIILVVLATLAAEEGRGIFVRRGEGGTGELVERRDILGAGIGIVEKRRCTDGMPGISGDAPLDHEHVVRG